YTKQPISVFNCILPPPPQEHHVFTLRKHYFDGIDQHGNAVIAYAAELSFLGLRLPYSSVMFHNSDNALHEDACLKAAKLGENHRVFQQPNLSVSAQWQALDAPLNDIDLLNAAAFTDTDKYVRWHCHTPKAQFSCSLNGQYFQGLGYAETLTLTLEPWRLPLNELYWGRFLSPSHTLVWLEWRGANPLKLLYLDGRCYQNFILHQCRLLLPECGLHLNFREPAVIKDEPLLTLARRFPVLNRVFGKDFLKTRETKWKSRAELAIPGAPAEAGWALYEKVLWRA
ncbi:hypothetical protein HMPREF9370_1442, partial [Neisseria wadsworthii 9715]